MKIIRNKIFLLFLILISGPFTINKLKAQTTHIEKPSPYMVNIKAIDYAFQMPNEIKSGWVTFKFENMGHEMHFAMMLKFKDGVTEEDFLKFSADPKKETFEKYIKEPPVAVGGPGFHAPGQESEYTINLEPGNYGIICNTRTKEGVPHRSLGMYKYFKVTKEDSGAERPVADLKLSLEPYVIKADGQLQKGRQTIEVTHAGGDSFDVHLAKLNDTSTIANTIEFFDHLREPSQTLFEGGAEQKEVDKKSYVTVDFEPGDYAFLSHEYSALGMYKKFSVPQNDQIALHDTPENRREVEVKVMDNSIKVPNTLKAGPMKFILNDATNEDHEIAIGRLENDKDFEDYKEYIKEMTRSRNDKNPENPRTGYKIYFQETPEINLNLKPGTYVVFCDHVNPDDHYHISDGELASFEVK
ncbi:hypothetical protein C7S20_03570 [Christiangramia fulva]|uniref:Uncharacterized protein n=1 Tax=Christiangramia fulva TaxID=2126553 RepID=A0A2R3Z2E7_9FLAO|nr:hypothetical protein [Christiangramia fulva]AVR44409.1 hypothetical protein C7S20_03570 [Christiangramia fulva]